MKKVVLFVMVFLVFLSGCNDSVSQSTSEKPNIDVNTIPKTSNLDEAYIEITPSTEPKEQLPDIFESVNLLSIYQPAHSSSEKYYNLNGWQNYIYDKFGIEINMAYSSNISSPVYYFNYLVNSPYGRSKKVFDYIDPELVFDLSPYYKKYNWESFIDPEYIKQLSINGGIYAVPTAPQKYVIPRYYNKTYLDILGIDVPTDINSFIDYLRNAKNLMEGEGILLPMFVQQRKYFQSTADIFRAFGTYVNSAINSTVSYNPNSKSYEDAVFSENIEEALSFIRTIQDENLMGISGEAYCPNDYYSNPFIGDKFKVNKVFATEYNYVFDIKTNSFQRDLEAQISYEVVNGYYLSHLNSRNICEIRSDMGFYVFPKSTQNIYGTVDLFNTIMTDSNYYADLLYGVENTDYSVINEKIVPNIPTKGTFPGIRMIKPIEDTNSYYSANNIDVISNLNQKLYFESNVFNYVNTNSDSNNFWTGGSFHDALFLTCFSPQEAIEEYKKWFYKSGMRMDIEKMNEKIGAITVYDYN